MARKKSTKKKTSSRVQSEPVQCQPVQDEQPELDLSVDSEASESENKVMDDRQKLRKFDKFKDR